MPFPPRPALRSAPALALSIVAALTGACREEAPKAGGVAVRQEAPRVETARPAELEVKGRPAFRGASNLRCVLHDGSGLQINFRTGDTELPAVAVRIEEYQGAGAYRGSLFLTGRAGSGALLGSEGTVDIQVEQPAPPNARGVRLLNGFFQGEYAGPAGKGSIEGRFSRCPYGPSTSARAALPETAGGGRSGP